MTTPSLTITIYIPSYNQAAMLRQAIDSVLAQTRLPDQFLIIDDCSTDESREVIEAYHREHPTLIEPIYNEHNLGIGGVRALAVERARCDLITYLDGDDLYEPRKLELEERALLDDPDAGYAYSNFTYINRDGEYLKTWCEQAPPPSGNLFDTLAAFAMPRGVCHRCELMRTDIIRRVGAYKPGLNLYEDYDLDLRISREHRAVVVGEPTHKYRVHGAGLHRTAYTRHYDSLIHIYDKNAALFDSLPEPRRSRVRSAVDAVLARYAWRAVKQHANGEFLLGRSQLLRYARAGVAHKPASALSPKHALRVAIGLVRAAPISSDRA